MFNVTLRNPRVLVSCFVLAWACGARPAAALDGNNTLRMTPMNGWNAFEIVTQHDDISAIAEAGYGTTAARGIYDGLGGYLNGDTLSIYLNHETSNAAISRVNVDVLSFKQAIQSTIDGGATAFPASFVTQMTYAYDAIFDGTYHAITNPNPVATGTSGALNYGNSFFDRFCSGTSYQPDKFGNGSGFVDHIYLTGEEVAGGKFYAIDQANDTIWEVPDLGLGYWENAALVDTGNSTHTALILSSDLGTSPGDYLRLYVGEKGVDANGDGTIDFVERNGMRGGTVYFFDPDGAASTIDLPDGTVTGTWSTSTAGALRETKLEDVATSPFDGTRLALGATNDGVYTIDLGFQFSGGSFDNASSTAVITQIDDDDDLPIRSPDNLDWSANNKIYVQEDGDGNEMWEIDPDGNPATRVQIATAFTEPSGIYDVSGLIGYEPGSVLLSSIQGITTTGAQLVTMVSPNAALAPIDGDLDGDGFVGIADLNIVLGNWNQTVPPGDPLADPSGDGFVGIEDLNAVLGNWNAGTPPGATVPEPASAGVLGLLALALTARRRVNR